MGDRFYGAAASRAAQGIAGRKARRAARLRWLGLALVVLGAGLCIRESAGAGLLEAAAALLFDPSWWLGVGAVVAGMVSVGFGLDADA